MKKTTKKAAKGMKMKAAPKPEPVRKTRAASRPKNKNSYTQSEFIENVRAFCGMPKRAQAKELIEDFALFIKDGLKRGYKIPLCGLGKIYVRQSKARMGRNPATGEQIHIAARKRVRFTAAKALKEAVL